MPSYKSKTGYTCSCPDGNCDMSCRMYRLVSNKPSNADRIRAMSDKELADKFEEVQLNTIKTYSNDHILLAGELRKYWLDWLREEAET